MCIYKPDPVVVLGLVDLGRGDAEAWESPRILLLLLLLLVVVVVVLLLSLLLLALLVCYVY